MSSGLVIAFVGRSMGLFDSDFFFNIENLNLFVKLSQRQNNFLKYFENFIPILLVLLQKLT